MAATIITVSNANVPEINIKIKVNDGHPIPTSILTDSVQTFRTWKISDGHVFMWTNIQGSEMSMIVPNGSIGWVIASMPKGVFEDRFRIYEPCTVTFVTEI